MAYICNKPKGSCKTCNHYRYDSEENCYGCFALMDEKKDAGEPTKIYAVMVTRNCNTSDDVEKKYYEDYAEAARNFWKECEMLVRDYMEPEDHLREWVGMGGIIEQEYGGIIKNDYMEFDGNVVSLEEIERGGK